MLKDLTHSGVYPCRTEKKNSFCSSPCSHLKFCPMTVTWEAKCMPLIECNPSMVKPERCAKDKQHLEVAWTVKLQKSPLNQTPNQNLTAFCLFVPNKQGLIMLSCGLASKSRAKPVFTLRQQVSISVQYNSEEEHHE